MRQILMLATFLFFVTACGSDSDSSSDPADCTHDSGVLSGTVLSQAYEFKQGTASLDSEGLEYQVFLFGQDEIDFGNDPCTFGGTDFMGTQLTFFVGTEPENVALSTTHIVTLFNATSQDAEFTRLGCYELTTVTATTLTGKITLDETENGDMVSGTWTAEICN